jgi:hypothetical protein
MSGLWTNPAAHWLVCPVRSRWRRRTYYQPFWRDDRVAKMFDIDMYGCPRCGRGAIEERDAVWPL